MRFVTRLVPLVLTLSFGAGGCAAREPVATDTIAAYRRALEHDDPRAAWALLGPDARASMSMSMSMSMDEKTFVARWREAAPERERLLAVLRANVAPTESATVHLSDGRALELDHTSDGWRIRSPRPQPAKITTPDELLKRLEQALAERSYPRLADLLSDEARALFDRQLADRLAALRARSNSTGSLETRADRIRVRLGEFFVDLIRKDGVWHIADFN